MIPSQKITTAAVAGAITTILLWILEGTTAISPPAAVAAGIVLLVTVGLGYLVPETRPAPSAVETVLREHRQL